MTKVKISEAVANLATCLEYDSVLAPVDTRHVAAILAALKRRTRRGG